MAQRIAFWVAGVLILAGLWTAFRPSGPEMPAAKSFELVVRDGKLVSGPALLEVRQGEQVTLQVRSNATDELHLHGYELKLRLEGGEGATLQFAATRSGRFALELHHGHSQLGALQVQPR